ncbi:MAG: hypothetical protein E4H11_08940 [Myxococcales bacterium]|nr:MAG: hypothetical protein E4H11_08940 [Myxococcales bacterium]
MRGRLTRRRAAAAGLAALACAGFALLARASSYGPQPALTGVPGTGDLLGEMTCLSCHATSPLNPDGIGRIRLEGLPPLREPGRRYPLVLRVEHPAEGRQRWGFQLTAVDARTLIGAGRLVVVDPETTQVIEGGLAERQYVEHTETGTGIGRQGGMKWSFDWIAPASGHGDVAFFAAVNVANGDGAKEGDWIFAPAPSPLVTLRGPAP